MRFSSTPAKPVAISLFLLFMYCSLYSQTNYCLDFGGNQNGATNTTDDDYLTVPDNNALDITSAITIEAWIYRTATGVVEQNLIDKSVNDAACNYRFSVQNDKLAWWRSGASGGEFSTSSIPANVWVHVAMTLSGGTLKFYINGVLDATVSTGNTTLGSANAGLLYIGNSSVSTGTTGTRYFYGRMEELRIWSVARSAAEIKANAYNVNVSSNAPGLVGYWRFNDGSGTTLTNQCTTTGSALDGSLVNSPAWTASPVQFGGNALQFNGTSNYVELTNRINIGSSNFTIEAWVYPQSTSAGMVFAQDVCGDAEQQFRLYTNNSKVNFDLSDAAALGVNYSFQLPSTANSVPLNTWTHVAAVRTGNSYAVYINGVSNATYSTGAFTINNQSGADVNKRLRIGARGGVSGGCGLNYFSGRIDDVRFWNVARTGTEIQTNYLTEVNPATNANLAAYYTFNQGIASGTNSGLTTLIDRKGSNNGTLVGFTLSGATSNFIPQNSSMTTLPLKWLSFTAIKQNNGVLLQWKTANERNTASFVVEHKTDGSEWKGMSTRPADNNEEEMHSYTYLDGVPGDGANYYRVKQIDVDGRYTYSEIISIKLNAVSNGFKIVTNSVTNGMLEVQIRQPAQQITLLSTDGKIVWKRQLVSGVHNIDVSQLRGVYILTDGTRSERLIVR